MNTLFENLDDLTKYHSIRVADLSKAIAKKLQISNIENVYEIAKFHDIGKQLIDQSIILKPEKLTDEEFEIIKTHTKLGVKLMRDYMTEEHLKCILYHHENVNGTGYYQKKDFEIPYVAKIIRITDVYDALTSTRCYKDAYDKKDALFLMKNNVGQLFDNDIFQVFLSLVS